MTSETLGDLTAEERVLLRLARQDLRDEDARLLRAQKGIDWEKVASLALRGGIAGLVESNLRRLGLGGVQRSLAMASLHTEAENRLLLRETVAVCAQASALGTVLLPLKGIALIAAGLYSNPGFRSMCDVDLLCRPDQFEQVLAMLRDTGFEETSYIAAQRDYSHHVSLVKSAGKRRMMFELHWQPTYGFFDFQSVVAGWYGRSGRVSTVDGELPSLSPTDLLLSVGLHLATHRFRDGLKWLVDIAEISRRWQAKIDWEQLWDDARRLGAVRALAFAFKMAVRLLDAPISELPPPGLRERLGPPPVSGHGDGSQRSPARQPDRRDDQSDLPRRQPGRHPLAHAQGRGDRRAAPHQPALPALGQTAALREEREALSGSVETTPCCDRRSCCQFRHLGCRVASLLL